MRSFGVVPEKPTDKFFVECGNIVPQKRSIEYDEVFRDRAVESFNMCVHLGRTRIRVEVSETENDTGCLKQFGELASIVCLKLVNQKRTNRNDFPEKVRSTCGGVA